MLRVQLRVNGGQFAGEVLERVVSCPVRQGGTPCTTALGAAQLLDPAHGAMDRPKLTLELRDQVELMRDEDLGVGFKGFQLACSLVRHTSRS